MERKTNMTQSTYRAHCTNHHIAMYTMRSKATMIVITVY